MFKAVKIGFFYLNVATAGAECPACLKKTRLFFYFYIKMPPVSIGDAHFKSKKDAYTFVKNKLDQIGFGTINEADDHFQFLLSLLHNHPEAEQKRGAGISSFSIRPNPISNGKHITVCRTDHSIDTFSWRACCGLTKSPIQWIAILCRQAVSSEMYNFRKNKACQVCGSTGNLHTHHDQPRFSEIIKMFTKEHGTSNPDYCARDNNMVPCLPPTMHATFLAFHQEHARLQVLCKSCHLELHKQLLG
jgi:hypothetical protein